MVLSDQDIKKALASKRIVIKPTPDLTHQLGSCSIDLRLGNTFRVFDYSKYPYIDPAKRFLTLPAGAPSPIKRIYEKIKKENDETHFLDWFADKFGYAVGIRRHLCMGHQMRVAEPITCLIP